MAPGSTARSASQLVPAELALVPLCDLRSTQPPPSKTASTLVLLLKKSSPGLGLPGGVSATDAVPEAARLVPSARKKSGAWIGTSATMIEEASSQNSLPPPVFSNYWPMWAHKDIEDQRSHQ